jgi:hypothetical protein
MLPPPLIGAIILVAVIVVAVVAKNRSGKSPACATDSDCTPPQKCQAGTCAAPSCPTPCTGGQICKADGTCGAPSYTYTREANSNTNSYWGCQYPGAGLPSSTNDHSALVTMCNSKPDCIGYYDNEYSNPTWVIATNVEPSACTSLSQQAYPAFYRKRVS